MGQLCLLEHSSENFFLLGASEVYRQSSPYKRGGLQDVLMIGSKDHQSIQLSRKNHCALNGSLNISRVIRLIIHLDIQHIPVGKHS